MPLADWRDGQRPSRRRRDWDSHGARPISAANVAGGEGFDWYYPSKADRNAQTRTPITDGAYGKPWVFRFKDLRSWWGTRTSTGRAASRREPTDWVPEGKPICFTEVGCPAVDKGANQPNVFPDPKSSASAFPYYSTRSATTSSSGASARRCCPTGTGDPANNPLSTV